MEIEKGEVEHSVLIELVRGSPIVTPKNKVVSRKNCFCPQTYRTHLNHKQKTSLQEHQQERNEPKAETARQGIFCLLRGFSFLFFVCI